MISSPRGTREGDEQSLGMERLKGSVTTLNFNGKIENKQIEHAKKLKLTVLKRSKFDESS